MSNSIGFQCTCISKTKLEGNRAKFLKKIRRTSNFLLQNEENFIDEQLELFRVFGQICASVSY